MEGNEMVQYHAEEENEDIENLFSRLGTAFMETEYQANWNAIGKSINYVLKPVLQKHVALVVSNLYDYLQQTDGIHTQTSEAFLERYPKQDGIELIYTNINNNVKFRQNKKKFDYKVNNAVDFSKLFLPRAYYQRFDDVDLSTILTLIINIEVFQGPLSIDARKVRDNIRNEWAHYDECKWDDKRTDKCFKRIQQCIRSLRLTELEESKALHEVLLLRFAEKEKCKALTTIHCRVASKKSYLGTSGVSSDNQRCPACRNPDRFQEINRTYDNRLELLSPEEISEKYVSLIKLYPWLKKEMTKEQALCIASQILEPDHTEVLGKINIRRMVIDGLLKLVLHSKKNADKTLFLLRYHLEGKLFEELDNKLQNRPTKKEIEECELQDKCITRPESHAVDRLCMIEADKKALLFKIKDIVTIDTLNNSLLSHFWFNLEDHDIVCDHLNRSDMAKAASCLIETMEKYPRSIMNCFCDSLDSLAKTSDVTKLLGLREKYCKAESRGTTIGQAVVTGLFSRVLHHLDRIKVSVWRVLGFDVEEPRLGSILIPMRPLSANSWENLKRNCLSENILNVFGDIFIDEQVRTWLHTNDRGLLVSIYSEEAVSKHNKVAVVKFELISKDSKVSAEDDLNEFDLDNPIELNLDILCEELDICDELLTEMQTQELVPRDISDELKQANSRASKIRRFLKSFSQTEKGYQALKENLRYSNSYLFQELELRDNSKVRRNLLFQCEAQMKPDWADSSSDEQTHTGLFENMWQMTRLRCLVGESDNDILQEYLKQCYDNNWLESPTLLTYYGFDIADRFPYFFLTKDTGLPRHEQESDKIWDARSYKCLVSEVRTIVSKQRIRESEKLRSFEELFFMEDALQRNIFLLGKAGTGKSTFCKHLTDIWSGNTVYSQFDDNEVLKRFRHLFAVSCSFAEASESIFDMICNQLLCDDEKMIKVARQVLKNTPEECLIVVDGIDEWRGSANKATGLTGDIPGLPSRRGLENCVVLSTSRPERIHMLPVKLDKTCSVFVLHGIQTTEESLRSIFEKVEYPDPVQSCSKFLSQIEENDLTELIQFPLMLINVLNVWKLNGAISSLMSVNYSNMVEGLFVIAQRAGRIEAQEQGRKKDSAELPDCFCDADLCKQNADLITRLGMLAFNLLFKDDQNLSLIFSREQTMAYLTELDFRTSLAVGLLSKAQTFSRRSRRNDIFSFCHKTFQEFLGAMWLTLEQSKLMNMFLRQFRSTDSLSDNGDFILFLCGLSPNAGDRFWKYITKEIIEKDEEICSYRLQDNTNRARDKVKLLQKLVLQCIKESKSSNGELLYYFYPDIYIDRLSDKNDITLITGMMENCVNDIKSVVAYRKVPFEIVKLLTQMKSAITVRLEGEGYLSRPTLGSSVYEVPELRFSRRLKILSIENIKTLAIEVPLYLTQLTVGVIFLLHENIEALFISLRMFSSLQYLCLDRIYCIKHGESCCFPPVDLQSHHSLEQVELKRLSTVNILLPRQLRHQTSYVCRKPTLVIYMYKVNMSSASWGLWIANLSHSSKRLKVYLEDCNLDKDSIDEICSCSQLKVARDIQNNDWVSFKTI